MKKKILFIDDDLIILKCIELLFEHLNFDMTTCNDGLEGIEIAKNNEFNLIITDYKMPRISGIDLIKELKKLKIDSMFALISGEIDDDLISQSNSIGVSNIMSKPFDISKIVSLMEYC